MECWGPVWGMVSSWAPPVGSHRARSPVDRACVVAAVLFSINPSSTMDGGSPVDQPIGLERRGSPVDPCSKCPTPHGGVGEESRLTPPICDLRCPRPCPLVRGRASSVPSGWAYGSPCFFCQLFEIGGSGAEL